MKVRGFAKVQIDIEEPQSSSTRHSQRRAIQCHFWPLLGRHVLFKEECGCHLLINCGIENSEKLRAKAQETAFSSSSGSG
jgi:hypothetical protein